MRRTRAVLACAALLLVGCGGEEAPDRLIASARAYLQKNDPAAAAVQLKSALQQVPDSGEARALLGRALLDGGDGASAAVEFRKALAAGQPPVAVLPGLARALNAAGEPRKLTDAYADTELADATAQAELKTQLAIAHAAQRNPAAAAQQIDAALAALPGHLPARLLGARLKAQAGDPAAALAAVDGVLQATPGSAEAWLLKGDLLWQSHADIAAVLDAMRRSAALAPRSAAAPSAMLAVLLDAGRLDDAAAQLAQLRQLAPRSPQVPLFEARLELQRGNPVAARQLLEPLLAKAPGDPQLLYVTGVAQLQSGRTLQAQNTLSRLLQSAPNHPLARRALARAELQLGQPAKALLLLQPLVDNQGDADAQTLNLAAFASSAVGDVARAKGYYAAAVKARPDDLKSRTALAMSRLGDGDGSAAVAELRALADTDAHGTLADLGLVHAMVRRHDLDGALKAIDALERKQPANPLAAQLRGDLLLEKKEVAAARAAFGQALQREPTFFLAALRLAALDMAEQQPERARQRFDAILAVDPKNTQAMLALAELRAANGGSADEVVGLLHRAIAANPADVVPHSRLVAWQLRSGDAKAALASAQSAVATLPDNPTLVDALASVQLAAGEATQATASLNRLVALQPASPLPLLRLAEVAAAGGRADAALQHTRRALALAPHALPIQARLVDRLNAAGRQAESLAIARETQRRLPVDAAGHLLEGDTEASRRNWPAAASAYAAAQSRRPSTAVAMRLHAALLEAKRRPEADQLVKRWLAGAPNDAAFLSYLGDAALRSKDYAAAEARFRDVLRVQPDQPAALNNVAWLLAEQRKDGALDFAEKANQLQPNQPPFMDTLASVLAARDQPAQALALQKQVVALQPDAPTFRLHLASLYLRTGDKTSARDELERLARLGPAFAEQDEVERLRKGL